MNPPSAKTFVDIAANIRPLAEFYRTHKPEVQHIFLFGQDFQTLAKHPRKAARFGFTFHGKQIHYAEFRLLSEAKNV